jgi:hypothetical protein
LPGDSATELHCFDTVCRQVTALSTGVAEVSGAQWDVYPNPSSGYVRIRKGDGEIESVSVYNVKGQLLLRSFETEGPVQLPGGPESEVYLIKVETTRGTMVKPIRVSQ